MEIGLFVDEKWEAAILTINNSALLIKCQTKTLIITFKEIVYYRLGNDSFIHVGYMERLNGEAWKKEICISGNNNTEILNEINEKRNNESDNSGEYIPPVNNAYTTNNTNQKQVLSGSYVINNNQSYIPQTQPIINNSQISDENIKKQNEMNEKLQKPNGGIPVLPVLIIGIILFCGFTYFLKATLLNTKENLFTGGGSMWSYKQSKDIFAYQFKDNNKCKYIHKTTTKITEQDCTYKVNGHEVNLTFEDESIQKYKWNIKYRIDPSGEKLISTSLFLEGDNVQEYKNSIYSLKLGGE